MKDREKIKKGCLGCAGIGCATYIVLSLFSLFFYGCVLDTAMDAVEKCTFKQIATAQYVNVGGQTASGFDALMDKAKAMGVNVNWKLRKAIASKEAISDVKYSEKDNAPGVKTITVSFRVKSASYGEESVNVAMSFLVSPKSLSNIKPTVLLGLTDIVAAYKGHAEELEMETLIPGSEAVTSPGIGFVFLAALYADNKNGVSEFADIFIKKAEAKLSGSSSETPGVQMDR